MFPLMKLLSPLSIAASGLNSPTPARPLSMRGWVVRDFRSGMVMENGLDIPEISHPNHVLIKVKAASVNPIDTIMCSGYGKTLLLYMKQIQEFSIRPRSSLPFIGGRDCSGTIVRTGRNVTEFKEGDEVMAVIGPNYPGSHAEYVLALDSWCVQKPTNVSFVEAASLPYVACTAWVALVSTARLRPINPGDIRVLIHGGAGGVGTVAIQMLKTWGVPVVVATCSYECFPLVESLGAIPVDYGDESTAREELRKHGPYDVILDCAESDLADWSDKVMGIWRNCIHVSIVPPHFHDTDRYGLVPGLFSAATKYFQRAALPSLSGRWFSYAFFTPNYECLSELTKYVEEGKMKPVIESTYAFEELPEAYEKVYQKQGRGKTVIDFERNFGTLGKSEYARNNVRSTHSKANGDKKIPDQYTEVKVDFAPSDSEGSIPQRIVDYTESDDIQKSPEEGSKVIVKPSERLLDTGSQRFEASIMVDPVVPSDKTDQYTEVKVDTTGTFIKFDFPESNTLSVRKRVAREPNNPKDYSELEVKCGTDKSSEIGIESSECKETESQRFEAFIKADPTVPSNKKSSSDTPADGSA